MAVGAMIEVAARERRLRRILLALVAGAYALGVGVGMLHPLAASRTTFTPAGGGSFGELLGTNLSVFGMIVAFGVATFGAAALLLLFTNGLVLGTALQAARGLPLGTLFLATAPHALPELAGLVLGGWGALLLASAAISAVRRGGATQQRLAVAGRAITVGVLLIVVGAGIEAAVRAYLVRG